MIRASLLMAVFVLSVTLPAFAQSVECPANDTGCWTQYARDLRDHREWLQVELALAKARLADANQKLVDLLKELGTLKPQPKSESK